MKKLYLLLVCAFAGISLFAQTSESFTNIPASASSYAARAWTGDNGLPWNATDARTDQTIVGPAICIRNGLVSCSGIPNGIATLSFKHQQVFTGANPVLEVRINGTLIGTANPTTAVGTASFTGINVTGSFSLEIKQVTTGLRIIIDDVQWTSNNTTPCVSPADAPGTVSFASVTTNSMNVSFLPASSVPDQYIAIQTTSPTLTAFPSNGTVYNVDDQVGNGTVEYIGSSTSFTSAGLTPGITYYFFIFSLNSSCIGGPLYKTDAYATGSQATTTPPVCAAPTTQVSNVVFSSITSSTLGGSFTPAGDADSYLICYSTNTSVGFTPVAGTTYTVGQAVGNGFVTKAGTGNTFAQNGLLANTVYNFFFFPYNGAGCSGGPIYNTTSFNTSASTNNSSSGIPFGYYDAILGSDTCRTIKTKLKTRTITGMTPKTYGDLPGQYAISDVKPSELRAGAPNVIWDIYSDKPGALDAYDYLPSQTNCGSGENTGWNREHSVPQSWFTGGTAVGPGTDYFHIYPTDCSVNGQRSSWIYSEVSSPTYTSLNGSKVGPSAFAGLTGTTFEPINEYKGDLARSFLYFVTRYEDQMPGWSGGTNGGQAMDPTTYPSVDLPYLKLMLKWNSQDPVSQKEIDRNNAGYTFQGNRNPYIDHPEYVDRVWNPACGGLATLPVDIISFKGFLNGDKVKLEWEVMNELNLLQYEIERSDNGRDFTTVGSVKATNSGSYTYSDDVNNLSGRRLYYRLKKVDTDGKFKYSAVFTVHVPLNLQFSVYPNPVVDSYVKLQFTKPTVRNATLVVTDMAGRTYQQLPVASGTTSMTVNLLNTPAGMYLVKLVQDGNLTVQKIQVL
ncbi:MAG: endonuclease [Chitinophagaceae bacterium]